jgi:hypothetical protein
MLLESTPFFCRGCFCRSVRSVSAWVLIEGGLKCGDEFIEAQKQLAPLKAATDVADFADPYLILAKNGIQFHDFTTDFGKRVSLVPNRPSIPDFRSCHGRANRN